MLSLWGGGQSLLTSRGKLRFGTGGGQRRRAGPHIPVLNPELTEFLPMTTHPEATPYPPAKLPKSSRAEEGRRGSEGPKGWPHPQDPLQKGTLQAEGTGCAKALWQKGPCDPRAQGWHGAPVPVWTELRWGSRHPPRIHPEELASQLGEPPKVLPARLPFT